jgi:acylphosphatase
LEDFAVTRRVNIIVSGKVQGVCFRAATQKRAEKLGVIGWVRNLATGEVEIEALGTNSAIEELIRWSHKGSTFAWVKQVHVTELAEGEAFVTFEIR